MMRLPKILVFVVLPLFVLSPIVYLTAFSSNNGNPATKSLQWVVDENIACLNSSFCSHGPGLFTVQVSANLFSDHTAFDLILYTAFSKSGATVYRLIERDHSVWTTRNTSHNPFGASKEFVLASGSNRTTVFMNSHWFTKITQIRNFNTGVPVQQGSYGCKEVTGVVCPEDVSAHLSVTQVGNSARAGNAADPLVQGPSYSDANMRTGEIAWVVSANLGCFSSQTCQASGLQSKSGTWLLFGNHVAFGVVIGTQFSSNGLVT